jgi:hypothetical protein
VRWFCWWICDTGCPTGIGGGTPAYTSLLLWNLFSPLWGMNCGWGDECWPWGPKK